MSTLNDTFDEILQLPADLEHLAPMLFEQAAATNVPEAGMALFGCGDSLIAAQTMAHILPQTFGLKASSHFPREVPFACGDRLAIGISASGGTPSVVNALTRCAEAQRSSLILTGSPDSAGGRVATVEIGVSLPGKIPMVPGIRSYQSSLLSILALAAATLTTYELSFAVLKDRVAASVEFALRDAPRAAVQLLTAGPALFLGEGNDLFAAGYGAAKRLEICGEVSMHRDAEEYWHLERFLRNPCPVVLVASRGDTADTVKASRIVRALMAPLILIAPDSALRCRQNATAHIGLPEDVPEAFAAFVTIAPIAALCADEGRLRAVHPFQADSPEHMMRMKKRLSQQ